MNNTTRFPVYRLIGGRVCRQDVPGGDWDELDKDEANTLLSRLDGVRLELEKADPRTPIFHHPV